MKHYFTSLLFLLFILVSCKKDKNIPSAAPLTGTWELRGADAGIGDFISYTTGNGNQIKFSAGNKYETTGSYHSEKSGTFRLSSEVSPYDGKRVNLIRFDDISIRNVYYIVGDTLTFYTYPYTDDGGMIADGGGSTYVRIQN